MASIVVFTLIIRSTPAEFAGKVFASMYVVDKANRQ